MRRSKVTSLGLLLLVAVLAASIHHAWNEPPAADFTGRCVAIADGDTITVMYHGREERIRLHGIDCPEKKQPFSDAARKFTGEMVFNKVVTVEFRDRDRYGRTVGWVTTSDGRVLNLELVKAGLAWWYREYAPDDERLAEAESAARQARKGLWADKDPIPPWRFRRTKTRS